MAKKPRSTVEYRPVENLNELERNPRQITKENFEILKKSIKDNPDYFEARPVILSNRTGELVVIAGNQRLKAARALGLTEVPTVLLEGLTEEREREIIIRDNVENGEWDFDVLANEWDVDELGEWGVGIKSWAEGNGDYDDFVEKFKPKLTTDDCYTPPEVFEAVEKWVRKKFKITEENVRPFKPNGDYQKEDYTAKVVIDNPPFSIISEIVRWYLANDVNFFLFAPHLTLFSVAADTAITRVITNSEVIYENGAVVRTAFVTNMFDSDIAIYCSGELAAAIAEAQPNNAKELERYDRPKNCKVATDFSYVATAGDDVAFRRNEVRLVKNLDELKAIGKGLYGGGFLVSDRIAEKLAAEKLAAEKLAAEKLAIKVNLSEAEKQIVDALNDERTER